MLGLDDPPAKIGPCPTRGSRIHRFLEEALELVQACGCTKGEVYQLVDYVYGRPTGDPVQEVGGVMLTLAALCSAAGIDLDEAAETELERVWGVIDKIRAKRASKPRHSPRGPAQAALAAREEHLRQAGGIAELTIQGDAETVWRAVRALERQTKQALFAHLVAVQCQGALRKAAGGCDPVFEDIGRRLAVDPARWWRPTTETYFGRVGKEHLLEDLADVIGPVACKTLGAMKKAQRCALLTAWFADPAAVPTSELGENAELYRERMRTWLPTGMASAPR